MIEQKTLRPNRVPVILDTDIGTDIDDTWALALVLRSPELEVRLITSVTQDTLYRARLIARLLKVAGAAHIPIGIGPRSDQSDPWVQPQASWVQGYGIEDYPGPVRRDGVGALIETVMRSATPVTIVALGPLTNVAAALNHEPRIAERARFVGVHGCLRHSHRPGVV